MIRSLIYDAVANRTFSTGVRGMLFKVRRNANVDFVLHLKWNRKWALTTAMRRISPTLQQLQLRSSFNLLIQ